MTVFNVIARTIAINTNTFKDAKQRLNITPMYETEDSLHAFSKGKPVILFFSNGKIKNEYQFFVFFFSFLEPSSNMA